MDNNCYFVTLDVRNVHLAILQIASSVMKDFLFQVEFVYHVLIHVKHVHPLRQMSVFHVIVEHSSKQ